MIKITHQQSLKDRCTHSLQPSQYMWNYWNSIHGHIHHSWFHSWNPESLRRRKKKNPTRDVAWMSVNTRFKMILIGIKWHPKVMKFDMTFHCKLITSYQVHLWGGDEGENVLLFLTVCTISCFSTIVYFEWLYICKFHVFF